MNRNNLNAIESFSYINPGNKINNNNKQYINNNNKYNNNNIYNNNNNKNNNIYNNNNNNIYNNNNKNNNNNNNNIYNNNNNNNIYNNNNINMYINNSKNNYNNQGSYSNNMSQETQNSSFKSDRTAIKTGLTNLGDTSYLNAILHLFGNISSFMNYFLNPINQTRLQNDIINHPLSFVFYRLYFHFYPLPGVKIEQVYKPDSLLKVLGVLNIIYNDKKRKNPNELISFILNTLHNELNQIKNNNIIINNNIFDKQETIKCGILNFKQSHNSIVSILLNWFEIKESKCTQCNQSIYNFYTFNIYELDISGAFQLKNKQRITIYDCLYYQQSPKRQNFYCRCCNRYTQLENTSKIYCSPNAFIFSLDRKYLDNNYLNIPFYVQEKIDLNNFIEYDKAPKQYILIGIVSFGRQEKDYVSFCMSPVDKQWYYYCNENIQNAQLNTILNIHNNNMAYIPCILLYMRIN